MPNDSNFKNLQVDSAKVIANSYTLTEADRRYIDNQILALQTAMSDCVVNGVRGTWFYLDGGSAAVAVGDVVCPTGLPAPQNGLNIPTVTRATSGALTAAKGIAGVAIKAANPGGRVLVAGPGSVLPAPQTGLGNTSGAVRVNTTTGRLERVAAIDTADYPVGSVDSNGNTTITASLPPALMPAAGASSVADDIARSGGGAAPIDRVVGIKGVSLESGDTLAPGEVWVRGAGSTLRAGKPVRPGEYDVTLYGADPTGVADSAQAFRDVLALLPVSTSNLPGNRARIIVPPGNYRFDSPVIVDRRVTIEGTVAGGVRITCDSWQSAFVVVGLGYGTNGSGDDTIIRHIDFRGGPNPSAATKWAANTAKVVGDHVLPGNVGCAPTDSPYSWEFHYRCLKAGTTTTASASPAGLATARSWSAGMTVAAGDVVKQVSTNGSDPGRHDVLFYASAIGSAPHHTGGSQPASFSTANAGDTISDGDITWTAFTTGEPNWTHCQNLDVSEEWAPGETVAWGAVRRPTAVTDRFDLLLLCIQPDTGTAVTGNAQPAGIATAKYGDVINDDNGIQWQCWASGAEATPALRTNGETIAVGDKRRDSNGNRWVAIAIGSAPHQTGGSEPARMSDPVNNPYNQFDTVADGDITWRAYYTGSSMILDNGVVWSCRVASAVVALAKVHTKDLDARTFPNAAKHLQGDLGSIPSISCSFSTADGLRCYQCGAGVLTRGGDANFGTFRDVEVYGQTDFGSNFYPAERAICDRAFLGNIFVSPKVLFCGGPSIWVTSPGSYGVCIAPYFEIASGVVDIVASAYQIIGGQIAVDETCIVFGLTTVRSIRTKRSTFVHIGQTDFLNVSAYGSLTNENSLAQFHLADNRQIAGSGAFYADVYERALTGWWAKEYHVDTLSSPFMWSTAAAAEGYGLGALPRGFFLGRTAPNRFYLFPSVADSQNPYIYGCLRHVGDMRLVASDATPGGYFWEVCTTQGYTGVTWSASAGYVARVASGIFKAEGSVVHPTGGADQAWALITKSVESTVEPTWPGSPSVGDDHTDGQGNTWKYLGTKAVWSDAFEIKDPNTSTVTQPACEWGADSTSQTRSEQDFTTTTDNTTTTADSFTIPANTAVKVDVQVVAQQDDGSDMAWFNLRVSAFRDGSSAPTTHRAAEVVDSEPNTTGAAWTAVLDISGNDIRVRVTGDTGKTIKWKTTWQNDRVGQ